MLENGIEWMVGNGNEIKFWTDPWMIEKPLIDLYNIYLEVKFKIIMVVINIGTFIRIKICYFLAKITWRCILMDNFTIKSAL